MRSGVRCPAKLSHTSTIRKGGRPSALSCGQSQVFHCAAGGRSCSGGRLSAGCCFSISDNISESCSWCKGCSTALVAEKTQLAREYPDDGQSHVRRSSDHT